MIVTIPSWPFRLALSLTCYLFFAVVLVAIFLCFSWTPASSALPALAYGLTFASAIWLFGGWLVVALPSISVQLRYWPAMIISTALHGFLSMALSYWLLYHQGPVLEDRHPEALMYAFLGFLGIAAGLSTFLYLMLLRRFCSKESHRGQFTD